MGQGQSILTKYFDFFFSGHLNLDIIMTAIRIMTNLFIGMTILGLNLAPNCMASAYGNANLLNQLNGIIQNPVVSCQNEKKKILCLPLEYSKFDLPVRNEANFIDIGKIIFISIFHISGSFSQTRTSMC